jgi:hypothetical protein
MKKKIDDDFDLKSAESNLTFALSAFLILLIPILYFTFARHFYYLEPWIDNFSYKSADGPAYSDGPAYAELKSEKAFGIHFFGDYLTPNRWVESNNPWIGREVVTYPPVAIEIFRVISIFPYKIGLVAYEALLMICLVAPIAIATRRLGLRAAIISTSLLGCMAGPTIAALDRGNIVGFLPILYFIFGYFIISGRERFASVAVILAVSIKYFPIVLLSIFISLKKIWLLMATLAWSLFLTLGVTFFYPGSFVQTLKGLFLGAQPFIDGDMARFSCFNTSYTAGLWTMLKFFGFESSANWITKNSLIFAIGMSAMATLLVVFCKLPLWSRLVVALSITTMITPTVYSYSMNWVIAALGIALLPTQKSWKKSNKTVEPEQARETSKPSSKPIPERERALKLVTLFCLVLIAVPWPIAIRQTVELGCTTSVVGVVAFISVSLILICNVVFSILQRNVNSLEKNDRSNVAT